MHAKGRSDKGERANTFKKVPVMQSNPFKNQAWSGGRQRTWPFLAEV